MNQQVSPTLDNVGWECVPETYLSPHHLHLDDGVGDHRQAAQDDDLLIPHAQEVCHYAASGQVTGFSSVQDQKSLGNTTSGRPTHRTISGIE